MAGIYDGYFGIPRGRVGALSFYLRQGRPVVRPARNTVKVKATPARLIQREKLKVCSDFTRAFTGTGFFGHSFPAYGQRGTGYNRAMSGLMHLAIRGDYPNLFLAYERVLVAQGPLPFAENASVASDGSGRLLFSWTDNSADGTARATDRVMLVAYVPSLRQAISTLDAGIRSAAAAMLQVHQFAGYEAATWIAFINEHGDVSDSVFTGMVHL